jgi:glycosyltransferase involved in cell wall biosynthesis
VVVVVPRRPSRTGAVDSQLLAAAHLSRGFAAVVGDDQVVLMTADGVTTAAEVFGTAVREGGGGASGPVARLPLGVRLALADVRSVQRARRLRTASVDGPVRLVVQYHHRFQDVGRRLADAHHCPLVLRVEALEVDEQRDWGMARPVLGPVVARLGEHRRFRRADLVSTVSEPLAAAVRAVGVPADRVRAQPNGVDLDLFRPGPAADRLSGRFVVGWTGGFRPYHGLAQVADILPALERRLPEATLCLVGTGPMRAELEEVARRHPRSLALLPAVRQAELPGRLRGFDVGFQLATVGGAQHYSPLKVLEYLACGRPVVAPDTATSSLLTDGHDALLYPTGDVEAFVDRVVRLHADPDLAARLGAEGRRTAERRGSWAAVARAMLEDAESARPLTRTRGDD